MGGPVRVNVLGRIEIVGVGMPRPVSGAKARLLLVRLALTPAAVVPRDVLIDELWPDRPPAQPGNVLRVHLSGLRSQLRDAGGADVLRARAGGWTLDLPEDAIDHTRFTTLVGEGSAALRRGAWAQAAERFECALHLWRDRPFVGVTTSPDIDLVGAQLEQRHEEAVAGSIAAKLRLGCGADLLPLVSRRFDANPLDESAAVSYAHALQQSGRCVEALEVTRASLRSLTERGLTPTPPLAALEAQILLHSGGASSWTDPPAPAELTSANALPPTPCPTSEMLGRDDELRRLRELLERHRAVALVGLGGVGKTRLGLAVLQQHRGAGVFLPLDRVTSETQIAGALARAVGLHSDGDDELLFRRAVAQLGRGPTLIVIDNCEHVADGASTLAARLLDAVAELRVVLTSRVPPALHAARVLTVGPLDVGTPEHPGPGALMLADHASLDPAALGARWEDVACAVRDAGGLPLALELAGRVLATGRSSPPPVRGGSTDCPDPVARAVRWALGDLPPSVGADLQQLAELPDGFTVEFAGRVLQHDLREVHLHAEAARARGLLVTDHSRGAVRFHPLDPVRTVLRETTPASRRASIQRELQRTVADLAHAAIGSWVEPVNRAVVAQIDDEHQNLVHLLASPSFDSASLAEVAPGLVVSWARTVRVVDAQRLAGRALACIPDGRPDLRAELLLGLAVASPSLAHRVSHVRELNEARDLARACGRSDLEQRAVVELAIARGWSGDLVGASELLASVEHVAVSHPHPWTRATFGRLSALLSGVSGDPIGGVGRLVAASEVFAALGCADDAVGSLFLASTLARIAGDDDRALELLLRSSEHEVDRFSGYSHSGVAFEIARIAMARRAEDTEDRLRRALALLDRYGDHRTASVCRRDLGRWLLCHGDRTEGRGLLSASVPPLLAADERAAAVGLAVLSRSEEFSADERGRLVAAAVQRSGGTGAPLGPDERAELDLAVSLLGPLRSAPSLDDAAVRDLLAR